MYMRIRGSGIELDYTVVCDPSTVKTWSCNKHKMDLCDNHVYDFSGLCPYHQVKLCWRSHH